MQRKKAVSTTVLGLFMLGTVPFALAQQSPGQSASEAEKQLKVLEEQVQDLEAKLELKSKADASHDKSWDDHYKKVAKQLEEWNDWIDQYNVKD